MILKRSKESEKTGMKRVFTMKSEREK